MAESESHTDQNTSRDPPVTTEDEDETEEEIITASHPPKEVVDTVVTMTKNPDGSLKKTTRKTTRTLVTTTRVRRIRAKPTPDERTGTATTSPEPGSGGIVESGAETPGALYTFVGPKQLSQDDGENRITQATFTIMTPTSRTEVTYHEDDKPVSSMDPETLKHFQSLQESTSEIGCTSGDNVSVLMTSSQPTNAWTTGPPELQQHARTKTTVRKTVTASAAKATFVATGTSKPSKSSLLFMAEGADSVTKGIGKCDKSPLHPELTGQSDASLVSTGITDSRNPTNTDESGQPFTAASDTTEAKRTTRVGSNLVNKSLLFTKTSLESLKKPFALWTKEVKTPSTTAGDNATEGLDTTKSDNEDTDQLALLAMKESERLFSEAKLVVPDNHTTVATIFHPTSADQNDVWTDNRFQSLFSNLPLYQGYGLIAQQLSLNKKEPQQSQVTAAVEASTSDAVSPVSSSVSGATYDATMADWATMLMNLNAGGSDVNTSSGALGFGSDLVAYGRSNELSSATTDLLSLLDASTDRLLQEATKQWYTLGYTPSNVPEEDNLGHVSSDRNWTGSLPEDKCREAISDATEIREPKSSIASHHSIESLLPARSGDVDIRYHVDDRRRSSIRYEPAAEDKSTLEAGENKERAIPRETPPHLSRLGVTKPGAFRVAWSEMPEVLSSGALKRLTKHEIQLQEAMFEVITSEASYYQSLNVLVNHFYHAPEFGYETGIGTHVIGSPAMNRATVNPAGLGGNKDNTCATGLVNSPSNVGLAPMDVNVHPDQSTDISQGSINPTSPGIAVKRPLLKPLEKHHLFSNVLLVCLASEKFLRDLETRWVSQMPVVNEVCDLIVKHAGGANFEPYVTYLRNQTYQLATLRKLCQRESFRAALETLHANPISGKNSLSSFLALPMQRLTRLKLLVEVIRRLQESVLRDAREADAGKGNRPFRIPTDRERENVQLALYELSRLLASSETEKELMEQKARLLTLSNSLEFLDTVKSIAISDKRLIKEGELREVATDGRISMLQKLSLKKPNSYYFILFNDLLLVTKRKKNDRYLVLDYCERAEIQAEVQRLGENPTSRLTKFASTDDSKLVTTSTGITTGVTPVPGLPVNRPTGEKLRTRSGSPIHTHAVRPRRPKTTADFTRLPALPRPEGSGTSVANKLRYTGLSRSGSSVSSYQIDQNVKYHPFGSIHSPPSETAKAEALRLVLTASHNGTFNELTLLPKDMDDFLSWCKALAISPTPVDLPAPDQTINGAKDVPQITNSLKRRLTFSISHKRDSNATTNIIDTSLPVVPPTASSSLWFQRARKACSFRRTDKSNSLTNSNQQNTHSNNNSSSINTNKNEKTSELIVSS